MSDNSTNVTDSSSGSPAILNLTAFVNVVAALIGGIVSLIVSYIYAKQLIAFPVDQSKKELIRISGLVHEGAVAFLNAEYKYLSYFIAGIFVLLAVGVSWQSAICFVAGAALSATSGYLGMQIATLANVRTCLACQGNNGMNNGLQVAFKSGAVMGLMVVGCGLTGLSVFYLIFRGAGTTQVWEYLSGFAFGGSSIALFARVGGGIYTKAADVGADLVGKVEEELDEDSPDNPATIADNVGDNVGDVAGMGADLFESFVGSIVAAATLGQAEFGNAGVALPFWVAGLGAFCSIYGTTMVKTGERVRLAPSAQDSGMDAMMVKAKENEATLEQLLHSINRAVHGSSVLVVGVSIIAAMLCFGNLDKKAWSLFGAIVLGLVCGNLIAWTTEYATSYTFYPTKSIADKSATGPATVIIQGLGVGMLSTIPPLFFVVATILGSYYLVGSFYGPSIAAVGMLATLGVTLATDAFGPVADNAGGIAEMSPSSEISDDVREITDALDALGNTTAATGKGFAIGSAVLTALALMTAFSQAAKIEKDGINLLDPVLLPCILLGGLLPFVFAALTMLSVGKAAESIMWECREQMNKKYLEGVPLDPTKCVRISTVSAIHEMVIPGVLAVFFPVVIGTLLGARGLLGLLAGAISAGFLLAVMMANAGGAWDNAKKYVEKGNLGAGRGKKSANHKAVIVGDTVGDPFKDTSGPALNILIKLMSIVSLVIAPRLQADPWDRNQWWIAAIISVLVGIFIYFFVKRGDSLQLHNREQILADSVRRKAATGSAAHEEERVATADF